MIPSAHTAVRVLSLLLFLLVASTILSLTGCTTTDPYSDTTIYPTAAEKNHDLQESMSRLTRTLE